MQKDKHNIYSKEELLKLIKEGKNAPADMDEFEREALEGLKLLDNLAILNKLNEEVDTLVAKEKNKKLVYYLGVAASLLLIIGLVFFFKNEVATNVIKNDKPNAVAENLKPIQEPNTTSVQPETQTTYEAKEPEEAAKKTTITRNEKHIALLSQTNTAAAPAEEKMQDIKQEEKEADKQQEQFEAKKSLSKADNYEDSKATTPQAKQEQQKEVVVNKQDEESNSNNTITGNVSTEDQSKAVPAATGSTNQPMQMAFSKNNRATNNSAEDKKDESIAAQKNKTAGLYQANSPNKKSAKSYRDPAYIGGDVAFATYVKQNLKISSLSYSGIIEVEFLITKAGKAEKIKIIKPLADCNTCSQDVIDLIKSVKKWAPATIDGENSDAIKKISIQYN
ncbi:MAG TPA: hypothetical protein VKG26_06155 [Bacteroidia bacterium]|nr:hypothetical protein [Bacteroidia bacterium]